ncbi:MAG: AbrB/MazE/SpoVT family DNA-binding domain-containing protein [Aeromicrobium sp.]|nr:AbrB/MazE/SpoVT family DNA-binding domain-containing protein [Burkholderiales bacterium]
MNTVTISPKFQVVIPQAVREAMQLSPGEKMQVLQFDNRVELIVVRNVKNLRGALSGIDTTFDRDADRI